MNGEHEQVVMMAASPINQQGFRSDIMEGTGITSMITTPIQQPSEVAQQYCLRWNSYPATIATQLASLKAAEEFVDVTLACDGQQLRAHKLVLSACSPYFMQLFKSTPCQHPVVFLRDVRFCQLLALLEFMYAGEVNVSQADLPALLRTAEALQVRGLADTTSNNKSETQLPPPKPDFLEQQYVPLPVENTPEIQIPVTSGTVQSQSSHHQLQQLSMDIEADDVLATEFIPQRLSPRIVLPELPNPRSNEGSVENESSKENKIDASSSDSNDSQDDYVVPGCHYDEKMNQSHEQQQHLLPITDNACSNINYIGGGTEEGLSTVMTEPWSMGLGSISLGGSQSEEGISDDDDEDDGEIKEDFMLPLASDIASYRQGQDLGENKTNSLGENVIAAAGPSQHNSFPFPATNSNKSKDLTASLNTNPTNNVPLRNRFSRALWPPGVPYHGPQQCPYCTRVLSNVGNWRKHVYTMHFSREKNFKCCHCNSSFRTSEYLQKHYVRVHSYAPKMSRKKGLSGGSGISASSSKNQSLPDTLPLINTSQNP